MKNILKLILILIISGVLIFLLSPSSIKAVKYKTPTIKPLENIKNINISSHITPIAKGQMHSSEGLTINKDGIIYSGNGPEILRIFSNGKVETFAATGGQNLGIALDNEENLIVANNPKGLLKINKNGEITNLLKYMPIKYPNGIVISSDGTIYFSDSSSKFNGTKQSYYLDLLEAKPYGRLFSFNPKTKELKTLLDNLRYANGVALSKNEDFLLVNESYGYKIDKFYIKGPKKGQKEIFIDGLYGYPDGISSDKNGNFYVAIFANRSPFLDRLQNYSFLKEQIIKFPKNLRPKLGKDSSILVLNQNGKVIKKYNDTSRQIYTLSSAQKYNNTLYIGTLTGTSIWKYPITD